MLQKFFKKKESTILGIIIILALVITLISPRFLKIGNFVDMAKGNTVLGIMALGMLPVLISGGIDLSIVGTITLSSVITGVLLTEMNMGLFPVILIALLVGALIGLCNGLLITKLKIPPIVATLGINSILLGAVLYQTDGNMITNLPEWFKKFGTSSLLAFGEFQLPIQVILYIAVLLVTYFLLNHTLIGRGFYAVGGNETSAIRVGYPVDRIKIMIYMYCGMLTALAGVVNTSIVQGVNPNTYIGLDMSVISIAVIGGASILGGVGTVWGTFLGTVLMAFLANGLILGHVPTFWQKIVMGLIILLAISIDVINRKKEKAKLVNVDVEE